MTTTLFTSTLAAAVALLTAAPVFSAPLRVPPAPVLPAPQKAKVVSLVQLPLCRSVMTQGNFPCRQPNAAELAKLPLCRSFLTNRMDPSGDVPCRQPNAAELAKEAEFQQTMYVHGLKMKADQVCRVTEDIKLFNPYGGIWASKGSFINAVAAKPSDDWNSSTKFGTDEYAHLVKDCNLGRMAQFAGHSAENQSVRTAAYLPGIDASPIVGGPVLVRSHTRCNSSKCWPVRSYTRSR